MKKHFCVLMGLLVLVGCGTRPSVPLWPEARPLGRDLVSYRAPVAPDGASNADLFVEPVGELTMGHAFAAALLNNPDLASFAWNVRMKEAQMLQASLLPNPEIEVESENFGGTGNTAGPDAAETTILFRQRIEFGQKRRKRTRLMEFERHLAAWDYEAARIAVLTEVAGAFIKCLVLQQRVDLASKNRGVAQQSYEAIVKRVDAGAAPGLDRTNASVVVARAQIDLRRWLRDLEAAKLALAATWGARQPRFDRVQGDLYRLKPLPSPERLAAAAQQSPQIARWATELRQRQARIELEKSKAIPDVAVGVGAKHFAETDDTAAVAQFSVLLPLFNRNQGGVLQARYDLARARQVQRAAEVRVHTALGQAYLRLVAAHREVMTLQSDVLPAAQRAHDETNIAYAEGKIGYLNVLDAQRTLFETRGQLVEALATYHTAVVEVEGIIGQALPLGETKPNNSPQRKPINGSDKGAHP